MANKRHEKRSDKNPHDGTDDAEEALANLLDRAVRTHKGDKRRDHRPIEALTRELDTENDGAADGDAHLDCDPRIWRESDSIRYSDAALARGDSADLGRSRQPAIEEGDRRLERAGVCLSSFEGVPRRLGINETED